ncbi:MAG: translation initiation factor IF-2 [Candidatus Omnitrophota bacterium]
MDRMRVHELAKELGMTPKELIPKIRKLGFDAKSHMSVVDAEIANLLRKVVGVPTKAAETKHETPEDPATIEVEKAAAEEKAAEEMKQLEKDLAALEPTEPRSSAIRVRMPITVGALATTLKMKIPDLIKELMGLGVFANVNQLLNEEIILRLAKKTGLPIEKETAEEEKIIEQVVEQPDDPSALKFRPPVVTMMGHVDHGKTSLLDAIRKTNVAAKEKGHITQHIGAYVVDIPGKGYVTFLDTPGHEAFTAMRARGANITDVVVLVIAADDGVMPQTIEAADHAREAGCPIVVAINKSDLPTANTQKVMLGLQKVGLVPEEWGGKTVCVKVSAKTGKGIDELLELLLLESEILELKANPNRPASGTVIESHLSKGLGPVATIIVQRGTLRIGDMLLCGEYHGRVRGLKNDLGKNLKEAGPAYAAEVTGLSGVPEAGETFLVVADERIARQIAEKRAFEKREREMRGTNKHLALEDLYQKISEGNFKELKLILKADVQGSIEALTQSLERLSTDICRVRVVHGGIGGINESDVMLAAASEAIVIGFHVKADTKAETAMEKEKVDVRYYNIIYEAVEDVKKALEGLLAPTLKEVVEGKAEIRQVFRSSKVGVIGGAAVIKGKVVRQHPVRLIRDNVVLFEGKLASLKRFKDDVRDVAEGYECGLSLENYQDIRERDIVECYRIDKIAKKLT